MKTRTAILIVLATFAAGGLFGYLFRGQKTDGSLILSAKDVITEEYITPPDTFSRIKNTRNALDSLSARAVIGIRDALVAYDRLPRSNESEKRTADHLLARAVHAGEAAMQEFEGTDQEAVIAQSFLQALRRAGQFNRWIEIYTKTLYTHPTHRAVCDLAGDAVKISKATGQQQRVVDALRYVIASPAEFAGRAEVRAALASAFASTSAEASVQPNQTDHPFNCLQL